MNSPSSVPNAPATAAAPSPAQAAAASARRRFDRFLLIGIGFACVGVLNQLLFGSPLLSLVDGSGALLLLLLRWWVLARPDNSRLLAGTHLLVSLGLVVFTGMALVAGGNASLTAWYLPTLPIVTAYLGGTRAAVAWAGIALVAALSLLAAGALPEAIICGSDTIALGVVRELHQAAVRVPEDVRVTGFDGILFAELSDPPLTTVVQPVAAIAEEAVRLLTSRLRGAAAAPRRSVVVPTLEVRCSSTSAALRPD